MTASTRFPDGVRTRAQSKLDRMAAKDRRSNLWLMALMILTGLCGLGVALMMEALWTMQIETLLGTPRIIY